MQDPSHSGEDPLSPIDIIYQHEVYSICFLLISLKRRSNHCDGSRRIWSLHNESDEQDKQGSTDEHLISA